MISSSRPVPRRALLHLCFSGCCCVPFALSFVLCVASDAESCVACIRPVGDMAATCGAGGFKHHIALLLQPGNVVWLLLLACCPYWLNTSGITSSGSTGKGSGTPRQTGRFLPLEITGRWAARACCSASHLCSCSPCTSCNGPIRMSNKHVALALSAVSQLQPDWGGVSAWHTACLCCDHGLGWQPSEVAPHLMTCIQYYAPYAAEHTAGSADTALMTTSRSRVISIAAFPVLAELWQRVSATSSHVPLYGWLTGDHRFLGSHVQHGVLLVHGKRLELQAAGHSLVPAAKSVDAAGDNAGENSVMVMLCQALHPIADDSCLLVSAAVSEEHTTMHKQIC